MFVKGLHCDDSKVNETADKASVYVANQSDEISTDNSQPVDSENNVVHAAASTNQEETVENIPVTSTGMYTRCK